MPLVGVRTTTLRADVELGFDTDLQISGKHLLYVRRPDPIESRRLKNLKDKNVRQVFVDATELQEYEKYIALAADEALNAPNMKIAARAEILSNQAKGAVEDMFANPKPREHYERTRVAAANQVALLLRRPDALEHVIALTEFDHSVYQHSVNVASLSVALAASVGAPLDACNALGVGGLLHDLGKSIDPASGKVADPAKYDEGSKHQHPRVGAGLLLTKNYVTRDVLDIILLHEERLDGHGYPAGVRKLDQIFQVVGLSNMYDRHVTYDGLMPEAAFAMISAMKPAPYDARLIKALKDLLAESGLAFANA